MTAHRPARREQEEDHHPPLPPLLSLPLTEVVRLPRRVSRGVEPRRRTPRSRPTKPPRRVKPDPPPLRTQALLPPALLLWKRGAMLALVRRVRLRRRPLRKEALLREALEKIQPPAGLLPQKRVPPPKEPRWCQRRLPRRPGRPSPTVAKGNRLASAPDSWGSSRVGSAGR